jgi:hypothetical protein
MSNAEDVAALVAEVADVADLLPTALQGIIVDQLASILTRYSDPEARHAIVTEVRRGLARVLDDYMSRPMRTSLVGVVAAAAMVSESRDIAREAPTRDAGAEALTAILSTAANMPESERAALALEALAAAASIDDRHTRTTATAAVIAAFAQAGSASAILSAAATVTEPETRVECLIAAVAPLAAQGKASDCEAVAREAVMSAGGIQGYFRAGFLHRASAALAGAGLIDPLLESSRPRDRGPHRRTDRRAEAARSLPRGSMCCERVQRRR